MTIIISMPAPTSEATCMSLPHSAPTTEVTGGVWWAALTAEVTDTTVWLIGVEEFHIRISS
jgi:hypothetical protein